MKHYYLLIRDFGLFNKDSVVYNVAVGSSDTEQVKLVLMQEFCRDAGWYFRQVSEQSDKAISRLADSLFGKMPCSHLLLRRSTISISEAYKRTIDDNWAEIENPIVESRSFFSHFSCFGHIFSPSNSVLPFNSFCQAVSRKYLSTPRRREFVNAMINFGLILILFLIGARLDYLYG